MSLIPSSFSWISFVIGILAGQYLLPLILGMLGRSRTATAAKAA